MQKRRMWGGLIVLGLVACGAESAPQVSQPPQPTVLARYEGMIVYDVGGTTYSSPDVVRVVDSGGKLALTFEKNTPWHLGIAWEMTELPPDRFSLAPLPNTARQNPCLRTTWTGQGSGEFTLARAQFDISAAVHQDTCEEGPLDSQFMFSFSGTAVR